MVHMYVGQSHKSMHVYSVLMKRSMYNTLHNRCLQYNTARLQSMQWKILHKTGTLTHLIRKCAKAKDCTLHSAGTVLPQDITNRTNSGPWSGDAYTEYIHMYAL